MRTSEPHASLAHFVF